MKANDIIQIELSHPWGGCLAVGAEACFILDWAENTEEKPYTIRGADND